MVRSLLMPSVAYTKTVEGMGTRPTQEAMRRPLKKASMPIHYALLIEQDLLGLVRDGDCRAFDELAERYQDRVYALARRILGDEAEAASATAEALVAAYRDRNGSAALAGVPHWIFGHAVRATIARHRCRDV